jgi:hypothetical protein
MAELNVLVDPWLLWRAERKGVVQAEVVGRRKIKFRNCECFVES